MRFSLFLTLIVLPAVCLAADDFDECALCGNNTYCINRYDTQVPVCTCLPGYYALSDPTSGGVDCIDINECLYCGMNTDCINQIGMNMNDVMRSSCLFCHGRC